ncbi:MAG: hypothetical protein AAF826_02090 [Pseudomonadota bacterium]
MATDLTKIATCCYCGSRTVLRLDMAKHELTCRSCGAELHNMKPLKKQAPETAKPRKPKRPMPKATFETPQYERPKYEKPKKRKRKKRRFDFGDILEDVFEEVFDIFD